jgi:hypothetical protein
MEGMARRKLNRVKILVSLPAETAANLSSVAEGLSTTQSAIVESALNRQLQPKGIDLLDQRISELMSQLSDVRRSLPSAALVAAQGPEIDSSFTSMAHCVAETLNDVTARLERLEEVLSLLRTRGASATEAAPNGMGLT